MSFLSEPNSLIACFLEMNFGVTFVKRNKLHIQQLLDLGLRCGPINKLGMHMMLG